MCLYQAENLTFMTFQYMEICIRWTLPIHGVGTAAFAVRGSFGTVATLLVHNCLLSRIIHVGTGIPELTIDQQINQKVPRYHRHVRHKPQEEK